MKSQILDHEAYMRASIAIAQRNLKAPFGAVLVDRSSGVIVAQGFNQSHLNPTLPNTTRRNRCDKRLYPTRRQKLE